MDAIRTTARRTGLALLAAVMVGSRARAASRREGIAYGRRGVDAASDQLGVNTMRLFLFVLTLAFAPAFAAAQPPQTIGGDWIGTVSTGGVSLRIALHLGETVTFDSLDQNANGLPATLERTGDHVVLNAPALGARFDLNLSADGQTLAGALQQGGASLPASFRRGVATVRNRPQTPTPPFPYREEQVRYANPTAPGVFLAGTLTLPPGQGRFPVALLITGSGAQDRDETVMDHKPFLVLADALTRRGIAVLRLDDRGVGGSTGATANDTSADFASDVEAGVAWLKTRADIDPARIGLIGHSEGAAIAPMVAARDPSIAFLVLLAAPGVRGVEWLAEQNRRVDIAAGLSAAVADQDFANKRRVFLAAAEATDQAAAVAAATRIVREIGGESAQAATMIRQTTSPWMLAALTYDPAPTLAAVKAPILALTGSKDVQVWAPQNLPAIKAANPRAEIVELPGLNHLFQTAGTGGPSEYGEIEETFSPVALKVIVDWLIRVVKP